MKTRMNNAVGPQVRAKPAGRGKFLPALGALSLGAGFQAATQFFAHAFDYQAGLGAHFNHVYAPWSIVEWSSRWYAAYPDAVIEAGSVGMLV